MTHLSSFDMSTCMNLWPARSLKIELSLVWPSLRQMTPLSISNSLWPKPCSLRHHSSISNLQPCPQLSAQAFSSNRIGQYSTTMKVFWAAAAAVLLPFVSADELMCVDDENQFNICLNVNGISDALIPSFVAARDRWDAAIDGDLDGTALSGIDHKYLCNPRPSYIDDVYVCAKGVNIDGAGDIIGHSLIPYHRRTHNVVTHQSHDLPLVGYLELDVDDASALAGPRLEALLEHELGHMVGVHGYFWSLNGNINMQTGAYHGGNAVREWQAKGCLGFPPLDKDGSDWNEGAFHYEIMSDYFTSCGETQCPLSSITLGTLQDIGYNVKYSKADPSYMPFCQTESGPSISENDMPPTKPTLSELKREKAIRYGRAILEQTAKEAPQPRIRGGDQRITYSADLFVNVFIEDMGDVHSVTVKPGGDIF